MRRNILFKIFEIFFMCMIASFPTGNSLPLHHQSYCVTDSDCNQPDFYCYESRECVECTNCSSYNRQPSPNATCAKNKDQCGNCNSGTEAEYTFYGTFTCQPISTSITKIHSNQDKNSTPKEETKHLGLYLSIPLSILVVIACLFLLIKYKIWLVFKRYFPFNGVNCAPVHLNNNIPTNAPPPYSEKSPSAPPEEDPLITRLRISHDDNQCANPFHPPNYVNGGSCSDTTYHPPNHSEPPTVGVDDENTQPSGWSPAPQNSSDLSNRPTSFLNILSTVTPPEQEYFEQPPNHERSNSESTSRNSPFIIVNINTSNMNNTQVINEI